MTKEEEKKAIILFEKGKGIKEIAYELHYSVAVIRESLNKHYYPKKLKDIQNERNIK